MSTDRFAHPVKVSTIDFLVEGIYFPFINLSEIEKVTSFELIVPRHPHMGLVKQKGFLTISDHFILVVF